MVSHWQGLFTGLRSPAIRSGGGGSRTKRRAKKPSHHLQVQRSDTMSIFGKIMSAIFGPAKAGAAAPSTTAAPAAGGVGSGGAPAASASGGGDVGNGSPAAPAQSVDVAAILDKAVAAKKEK